METKLEKLGSGDLELINRQTLREYAEDEVFTFSATFITDKPTGNGRIWSKEWQRENYKNFVGVPVIVEHEGDQRNVLGRVFSAEQKENAITGKVFVPLDTKEGRDARTKIESGLYKSMSLGARVGNVKREGDNIRVLPGKDDRVLELSFVAVPGCQSCEVSKESAPTDDEPVKSDKVTEGCEFAQTDPWAKEAYETHHRQANDFVRLAGFVFGTQIEREAYRTVAESCDPQTLRTITSDLTRIYEERGTVTLTENATSDVTEAIERIHKAKGA